MGDIISIGDSLIITLFSMAVVFVGLIVLSLFIGVLKAIGSEKKPESSQEPVAKAPVAAPTVDKTVEANDEELVAVIAAAIAASLGVSVPEIKIRSIRRVPQNTPAWATAGRKEQIYEKL